MNNPIVVNPNDFKVVEFTNSTGFDFTPDMGCMYDSRPIFGMSGFAGIKSGERLSLPYHIGHRLATNLAKHALIRNAPPHDPKDINPVGTPLWSEESLEVLKNTFITELYTNDKPVAMSETDKLMQQVEDLKKLVLDSLPKQPQSTAQVAEQQQAVPVQPPADNDHVAEGASQFAAPDGLVYADKSEVVAELTKRGIAFNPRESKAKLEKLLV